MASLIQTIDEYSKKLDTPIEKSIIEQILEISYTVQVSKEPIPCCVGMVDMVNSTLVAARVGMEKMSL